ncbi:regulatory particle non-ATPase [Basidiobolus ranarum]|uniref:Regulatory particle non-ATPase n=1 Tax=Basidiobolus ranarum TaxID=34480 RepID=A0ABR2WKF9_9FUNG
MSLSEAKGLYENLRTEFNSPNCNLDKCGELLSKLKIALTELSFLIHGDDKTNQESLLLAREVLEIGAQWSIRVKDVPSFERYIAQLKTYYSDYSSQLSTSDKMYPLIGLNLLRLLAQNKISEFHTSLESIEPDQLHNNPYIKHPVELEQSLMEGSYNKVWNSRSEVPAEEYSFFIDILMETIRNEIAGCSEKAYESLPLGDAATLLFFKKLEDVLTFAQERGWTINPTDKKIYFTTKHEEVVDIPSNKIIAQSLNYARELERIV